MLAAREHLVERSDDSLQISEHVDRPSVDARDATRDHHRHASGWRFLGWDDLAQRSPTSQQRGWPPERSTERFFGFDLGRRQWTGIALVAVSLALLTVTGGGGGEANSGYSLAGMIVFEGIAVGVGLILVLSGGLDSGPVGLSAPGASSLS